MKTLQNNFTTPEQSKRLLELGVPADSADCYYTNQHSFIWIKSDVDKIDWNASVGSKNFFLPCWSVGRLIEIRDICAKYYITHADFKGNYIENIIMSFYAIHATNGFDFSKLED